MKACYKHLSSTNPEQSRYYSQVDGLEVERTKTKIETILKDAIQNSIITKDKYEGMIANYKEPGRFYCNFKIHKQHETNKAPPERPIISGSGSITEGIGEYVNFHIKEIGTKHDSYIQDTPDFLRIIENINEGPRLPPNVFLATMDVSALFTNIIHKEGMSCMNEALDERENTKVPTDFIMKLMNIILNNNIFEFHETNCKQNIGAAMGSKPIPPYANIFMASIDKKIKELINKYKYFTLALLKRFSDDFFLIFFGSTKMFHTIFEEINKIHPTIKFTMSHTSNPNETKENKCDCPEQNSIPFLDVMCKIKEGKIETDLFKKKTDRNQYLLPSSCHPKQTTKAIPYSLSLRIIRICNNPASRDQRLQELKAYLLERGYQEGLVDREINRARNIPRKIALKRAKGKIIKKTSFCPHIRPKTSTNFPNSSKTLENNGKQ